jgi:hypothetical protein
MILARDTTSGIATGRDPNESQYGRYLCSTAPFFALATLAFILRIYARTYPKLRLKVDDFAITLAFVCIKTPRAKLS